MSAPIIILLEKDWMEAEITAGWLRSAFSSHRLLVFGCFGDFLLGLDEVSTDTQVIVTEDRLALLDLSEDSEDHYAKLAVKFPGIITSDWAAPQVPRLLLQHLSERGYNIPVIFFTHSEREWIDSRVLESPTVSFLEKSTEPDPLISCVRSVFDHSRTG